MVSTKNQLTIKIDRNTLPTNSHFYEIYGEILLAHIWDIEDCRVLLFKQIRLNTKFLNGIQAY